MAEKHSLVTIESIAATFAGSDISSVSEFTFQHQANAVPTLTLVVDAKHHGAYSGSASVYGKVGLSEASSLYSSFRSKMKDPDSTLSFSCSLRVSSPGSKDVEMQTLSVNGWVLIDVSIAQLSVGIAGCVTLTFAHPLSKASFGGGTLPGLVTSDPSPTEITGDNVRDNYISALKVYVDAVRSIPAELPQIEGGASQEEVKSKLTEKFSASIADFSSNTSVKQGLTLPALKAGLSVYKTELQASMGMYARPTYGSSVLSRFLGAVLPDYSLSLGGDYTKPLEVGPLDPWGAVVFKIADTDIVRVDLPDRDPCPLAGVRIDNYDTRIGDNTSFYSSAGVQAKNQGADLMFVPAVVLGKSQMYGPIQQFAEPEWLLETRNLAIKFAASSSNASKADANKLLVSSENVGEEAIVDLPDSEDARKAYVDLCSASVAVAKAYYVTSFCKDWTFNITARIMFTVGDSPLYAGVPIAVCSGGSPVMRGYIIGVTHRVSVSGAVAVTSIACSHASFAGEAVPGEVKGFGEHNGLYS